MASKVEVTLRGRFPAGSKVTLHERGGAATPPSPDHPGPEVGKGTVSKDGSVTFKGLDPGAQFWVVGPEGNEDRIVAITAKAPVREPKPEPAPPSQPLASVAPGATVQPNRLSEKQSAAEIEGAQFAGPELGKPTKVDEDAAPHQSQESVPKGTPQRSDTLTGQATPIPADELPPKPKAKKRSAAKKAKAKPRSRRKRGR